MASKAPNKLNATVAFFFSYSYLGDVVLLHGCICCFSVAFAVVCCCSFILLGCSFCFSVASWFASWLLLLLFAVALLVAWLQFLPLCGLGLLHGCFCCCLLLLFLVAWLLFQRHSCQTGLT